MNRRIRRRRGWEEKTDAESDKPKIRGARSPSELANGLPVYGSMQACMAATGIAKDALQQAKREGCPAFSGNRVFLYQFLKWWPWARVSLGGEEGETKEEAVRRKAIADANASEIEVAKAREELVLVEDVEKWATSVFAALRQGILASGLTREEQDELLAHIKRLTEGIASSADVVGAEAGGADDPTTEADGGAVGGSTPVPVERE